MDKIASFTVNHLKLLPGMYVSRRDEKKGAVVTTFDIRVTQPNVEPAMDSGAMHTMEHIGATFLRNSAQKDDVIYFGPMGCKTGFYLVMFGDLKVCDKLNLVKEMFQFIANFEGEIPGASAVECGNYIFQNPEMSKYYAEKYLNALETYKAFEYAE